MRGRSGGSLSSAEAGLYPVDVLDQNRPRTTHRSMYDAVGGIAGEDFVKSLIIFEPLSLRARGQVGGDECVHDGAVFERVRVQITQQPPLGGLEAGAGVVRDQGHQSSRKPAAVQVPGTVEWVEACQGERWRTTP